MAHIDTPDGLRALPATAGRVGGLATAPDAAAGYRAPAERAARNGYGAAARPLA